MGAVCEFLVYPAGGDRAHINLVSYIHNIWGNVCSSNHFQWCIQIFVNFVFADSYTDFLDNFRTLLSLAKLGFVYLFRFFFRYPLHTIFYLWLVFEMPSWNGISRGEFLSIGKKKNLSKGVSRITRRLYTAKYNHAGGRLRNGDAYELSSTLVPWWSNAQCITWRDSVSGFTSVLCWVSSEQIVVTLTFIVLRSLELSWVHVDDW